MHIPQTQQQTPIWNFAGDLKNKSASNFMSIALVVAILLTLLIAGTVSVMNSLKNRSAQARELMVIATEDTIAYANSNIPETVVQDHTLTDSNTSISTTSVSNGTTARTSGSVTVNGVTTPLPTVETPIEVKAQPPSNTSSNFVEVSINSSVDETSGSTIQNHTSYSYSSNTSSANIESEFWSEP